MLNVFEHWAPFLFCTLTGFHLRMVLWQQSHWHHTCFTVWMEHYYNYPLSLCTLCAHNWHDKTTFWQFQLKLYTKGTSVWKVLLNFMCSILRKHKFKTVSCLRSLSFHNIKFQTFHLWSLSNVLSFTRVTQWQIQSTIKLLMAGGKPRSAQKTV
jgi:hypothetical protein